MEGDPGIFFQKESHCFGLMRREAIGNEVNAPLWGLGADEFAQETDEFFGGVAIGGLPITERRTIQRLFMQSPIHNPGLDAFATGLPRCRLHSPARRSLTKRPRHKRTVFTLQHCSRLTSRTPLPLASSRMIRLRLASSTDALRLRAAAFNCTRSEGLILIRFDIRLFNHKLDQNSMPHCSSTSAVYQMIQTRIVAAHPLILAECAFHL